MNDYILQTLVPRLESLDARLKNLEQCRKNLPQIDISIEAAEVDELILQLQKIQQACANCNLKVSVNLKVA